jgi:hypothetical protein
MGMLVFEQSINSGQNFDGSLPPGDPESGNDFGKKWPIANTGGLFDFELTEPHWILLFQFKCGGQDAWSLSIVDVDDVEIVIWSGTTSTTDFATFETDKIAILQGQRLKLVTTGTPNVDMRARIGVSRVE